MKTLSILAVTAAAAGLLLSAAPVLQAQNVEMVPVVFTVVSDDHPSEVRKRYREFHRIIEEQLNNRLEDKQVAIQLAIAPNFEVGMEMLVSGEGHFARLSPVAYLTALQAKPELRLLAGELSLASEDGHDELGALVVAADSPIQSLADLRGTSIAFVTPLSGAGRYHSQDYMFHEEGLTEVDFAGYAYLGANDDVIEGVEAGEFDVGATTKYDLEHSIEDGMAVRILAEFPVPLNAWVANDTLPADIADALQATLLEMDDPDMLEVGGLKGFLAVDTTEYDPTRDAMEHVDSDIGFKPAE